MLAYNKQRNIQAACALLVLNLARVPPQEHATSAAVRKAQVKSTAGASVIVAAICLGRRCWCLDLQGCEAPKPVSDRRLEQTGRVCTGVLRVY